MLKNCIPLATLFLLFANPVSAQLRDFTMNWSVPSNVQQGTQAGVAVVTNQQVTMTSVGGPNATFIGTPCTVSGDFDVQVDFALLNWPTGNNYILNFAAIQPAPNGEIFSIGVESTGGYYPSGYVFLSRPVFVEDFSTTFDTFGKLRLIRTGSSVQAYFYSEAGDQDVPPGLWTPVGSPFRTSPATSSGMPLEFTLGLSSTMLNAVAGVQAAFSNFEVNSGTISCPVPRGLGLPSPTNPVAITSEPISTASGNYYNQHADLTIPGRGAPLVFERTYNSRASYSGPLGANWTHSFNIGLSQDASGNVAIQWSDGHFETYNAGTSGFTPQPGVFSTLTKNADGSFLLLTKDKQNYNFTAAGQLASIQDRNGNTTVLAYNFGGSLQSVTAAGGESLVLLYDSNNRIIQVSDPVGRTVKFSYTSINDLAQVTDAAGGVTTYTYDSSHRMLSATLPNGSALLQNTYDSNGRVIAQTNGRGFTTTLAYNTPATRQTTITDPLGNKTVHTYDSTMRIVQITDALGKSISFTYDSNNDRTSVTNQNGATANFSYDSQGNVTSIADANGGTSAFAYDAKNNLLTATNPKGNSTSFTYDGNSNLTKIQDALEHTTIFAYDSYGELASKTDARGSATAYIHDAVGNLTQITDPLGHITSLTYDGVGRITGITDPNGHTASAAYDSLNRLLQAADPLGNKTQFTYDPVGNLLKITDANGHATSYAYDATNNLTSVTDALGHITRYTYDANNNRVGFTNAKGNTTSYAFDALNRVSQITDPLSFVTSYSYDPVGNVGATKDAKGQTNQFAYDALNRLLSISYTDGKSVTYSYDADGNRLSMADSHGATAYVYDALDRLNSVTHPGGKVVAYAYDAVGQRKSLTYPDGKAVNYAYDAANRLSQATDWLGRTTMYSYDAASNLIGTAYPNQAALSFAYDPANRLTGIQNTFRKDKEEKRDDDGPSTLISFRYLLDAVGNRLQVTDSRGQPTRYSYDPLYELTSVATLDGSHENDDDRETVNYAYDAVGNRIGLARGDRAITYTYDADDRLLSAGSFTYTYDPNGNQTSVTRQRDSEPLAYAYDAANRLVGVAGGRAQSKFAYDGDGNRVSQSTGEGTFAYVNDVATALPVVLQESGPAGNISYAYGLDRISGSSDEQDFFYHYDGLGSVVALSDQKGRLSAGYFYDAWGNSLLTLAGRDEGENKFRFTGEGLDPGTQLYYLRARYYDPSIGRFVSKDPLAGRTGQVALQLNRYSYGGNNPIGNLDPNGLSFFGDAWNKATAVADTLSSGLALSVEIFIKGNVDAANFVTDGKVAVLTNLSANIAQGEQVTAQKLVASEGQVAGIDISQADQASIAKRVVQITNLASAALNAGLFIYQAPRLISQIGNLTEDITLSRLFGGAILNPSLTLGKDIISDVVLGTVGFGQSLVGSPK